MKLEKHAAELRDIDKANKLEWLETNGLGGWSGSTLAGYLYDVIDDDNKDATLRPNQLFAIGLPSSLVDGKYARRILDIVTEKLYTPAGLRTLPQDHPSYIGVYGGSALQRDSAYHQGTAWSWLLGIYIDALMKVQEHKGRARAQQVISH